MRVNSSNGVVVRPKSADEVSKYAMRTLRAADAIGQLPTPIDDLSNAAAIGSLKIDEDVKQDFSARLEGATKRAFESMWQKIRGIADLRERVTYVDENTTSPRIRFAKGHELGHAVLPWHRLDPGRFDDDKGLSWEAEEIFDMEANFFSAEVIFQGGNFTRIVRDYAVSFDSIFHIADMHDASCHATAWRYVEEQDESVALVTYWPSKFNPWNASVGARLLHRRTSFADSVELICRASWGRPTTGWLRMLPTPFMQRYDFTDLRQSACPV